MNSQKTLIKAQNPLLRVGAVIPSAFVYRYSVTSKENGETLGTGLFKTSRKMTKDEQLSFFHQYTNGMYLKKESFVSIYIFEADA